MSSANNTKSAQSPLGKGGAADPKLHNYKVWKSEPKVEERLRDALRSVYVETMLKVAREVSLNFVAESTPRTLWQALCVLQWRDLPRNATARR